MLHLLKPTKIPLIDPADKPWSTVFREALVFLNSRDTDYLCHAVSLSVVGSMGDEASRVSGQCRRMHAYILSHLGGNGTLGNFLIDVGVDSGDTNRDAMALRKEWATSLAEYFEKAGL